MLAPSCKSLSALSLAFCSRWASLISVASFFLSIGCTAPHLGNMVLGPDYQPGNVFLQGDALPTDFRRVAVLPLTCDQNQPDAIAGQEMLEPVLHTELLKLKRFELTWVTPDDLGRWTGKTAWDAREKLPPNFFAKLHEQVGCDGVLFCRLSRFRAYPPITIGWNLKLIETAHAQTLWAIDEIFDSGEPMVSNSARRYEQQHQKGGAITDTPMILSSPQRFGHYTAWAVLGTLPNH